VRLLRQLLAAQDQQLGHFVRLVPRVAEPVRVDHDLGNVPLVRDHHGDGSETHLQVVRQLVPARLARVHGDLDAHALLVQHLHALECLVELAFVGVQEPFVFDFGHHFGDHGEDVESDAVELVEAGPAALVGQPTAQRDDHFGFDGGAAVEHHAEDRQPLGQVLGGLGLAGSGRPRGRGAEAQRQSARDGVPAALGERRDDQPAQTAQLLLAVVDVGVHLPDFDVAALDLVAQLLLPVEVVGLAHLVLEQHDDHVLVVHLARDDRDDALAHELVQLAVHQDALVGQVLVDDVAHLDQAFVDSLAVERLLDFARPEQLPDGDDQLRVVLRDPLFAVHLLLQLHLLVLRLQTLDHVLAQRVDHLPFELVQPLVDLFVVRPAALALRDGLQALEFFFLFGDYRVDVRMVVVEVEDVVEELFEVVFDRFNFVLR